MTPWYNMAKSWYVGHAHKIKPIKKVSTTGGGVTEAPFLGEIYSQLMAADEGESFLFGESAHWRGCPCLSEWHHIHVHVGSSNWVKLVFTKIEDMDLEEKNVLQGDQGVLEEITYE